MFELFAKLCPCVGLKAGLAAAKTSVAEEARLLVGPASDPCRGVDVLVATPGRLMSHLASTPGFTLRCGRRAGGGPAPPGFTLRCGRRAGGGGSPLLAGRGMHPEERGRVVHVPAQGGVAWGGGGGGGNCSWLSARTWDRHPSDPPRRHVQFLVVDETDRLLRQSFQEWLPHVNQALAAAGGSMAAWAGASGPAALPISQQRCAPSAAPGLRPPAAPAATPYGPLLSDTASILPPTGLAGTQPSNVCPTHPPPPPAPDHQPPAAPPPCRRRLPGRVVKIIVSATLTRDPAKLQRLRLHQPRFIAMSATGPQRYKLPEQLQEWQVRRARDRGGELQDWQVFGGWRTELRLIVQGEGS